MPAWDIYCDVWNFVLLQKSSFLLGKIIPTMKNLGTTFDMRPAYSKQLALLYFELNGKSTGTTASTFENWHFFYTVLVRHLFHWQAGHIVVEDLKTDKFLQIYLYLYLLKIDDMHDALYAKVHKCPIYPSCTLHEVFCPLWSLQFWYGKYVLSCFSSGLNLRLFTLTYFSSMSN